MERKYTAQTFNAKMDEFIAWCEEQHIDATDYQLIKFFEISPTTLARYISDNDQSKAKDKDKYQGFGTAIKKLDLYREDATIRQAVRDPKLAGHVAFKLKQTHWGGWSDKQDIAGDVKIDVTINSGGSNPFG